MKIGATIQARTRSSRLPGKVLLPILGRPMLARQVDRIRQSRLIDEVVIATTDQPGDDAIEKLATELEVGCFRGSEDDVLSRVVKAIEAFGVELHVEFMADNPLPDPLLVDAIIGYYLKHRDTVDYVTNGLKTTYPPGMEVSVCPAEVLEDVSSRVHDASAREHVGVHIHQRPDLYRIQNLEAPPWLNRPDFHLEVDTQEDFEMVSAVVEALHQRNPFFGAGEIVSFLDVHPEIVAINREVHRRWRAFRQDN